MQFMALIYWAEGSEQGYDGDVFAEYMAFNEEAGKAGVLKAGDALQPVSTASSVQVRGGKSNITDGPFAETKEVLGGYYLLDCKDLDEALKWAAEIPSAKYGTIEVRPVMVFDKG